MKAKRGVDARTLTDIPNIGKAIAADLVLLGIKTPHDLKKYDAIQLYRLLNTSTGRRNDPCVLDTFLAAVDFMHGAKAKPWWKYTSARKKKFPDV